MRRFLGGMALAGLLLAAQPAGAALLGLPFSLPAIAVGFAGSAGQTDFDAATGLFSVFAEPTVVQLDPLSPPSLVTPAGGVERFVLSILVDAAVGLIGGTPGDDLLIEGRTTLNGLGTFSGVLLTAEVLEFGFQDGIGSFDSFDFRFRVTGGLLAFLFVVADASVRYVSEDSTFAGSFTESFTGGARGNIKRTPVIPEPGVASLLGLGLAGLALAGRPRRG